MAPPVAPGQTQAGRTIENILRERNAAMVPPAPSVSAVQKNIIEASPFPELIPVALGPPFYQTNRQQIGPGVQTYINNLLKAAEGAIGAQRDAIGNELLRVRQLWSSLN